MPTETRDQTNPGRAAPRLRCGPDAGRGRPHVCYLAYFFRPGQMVACVRTWNTARQLRLLGWNVTVITLDPTMYWSAEPDEPVAENLEALGIRRVRTRDAVPALGPTCVRQSTTLRARIVAKARRALAEVRRELPYSGWTEPCLEADAALPAGSVDLVLATGSPFASFPLAQRIAARHGCPYVLDYRDLWTGDPHYPVARWQTTVEASVLPGASLITTVSDRCAKVLGERFGIADKVQVLTNGFDPDNLSNVTPTDFGHPAVVYAGSLYPPTRSIEPVMAALARIEAMPAANGSSHKLHYYGIRPDHVLSAARKWRVGHRVEYHGSVPRPEALSAERGAAATVVITDVRDTASDAVLGIVTGKLFGAIGMGTPVALITPRGSDAQGVLARAGGGRSFTGSDIDGIARYLWERFTSPRPVPGDASEFSWEHLGRRLDGLLRSALTLAAFLPAFGLSLATSAA